jgi:hypothetical protein
MSRAIRYNGEQNMTHSWGGKILLFRFIVLLVGLEGLQYCVGLFFKIEVISKQHQH